MAEYVAFSQGVEVLGLSIQSVIDAIGEDAVPIMKDHGLYPIESNHWYDQQHYLDAYKEIDGLNLLNLVAVGMSVPDNAEFPPDIQTVEDALASLNVAYQMNHRGGDIGEYRYESTGERSGKMICRNPYPSDFDYGLIYRLIQKFRTASDGHILVKLDTDAPSRKNGHESCTYLLEW